MNLLDCSNCGIDLLDPGEEPAEWTWKRVDEDLEFGGAIASGKALALQCPRCDEVTAL